MEIETDNKKSVKGRIVTAAWQLFYEKGYKGIFRSCEGNSSICGTEYLAGKLQSKFIRMYYEERSQESVI